ncbi:MAG: hypothetical protein KatS3mg110_1886 [Pirellulaceae bacterium]|nr:MAG: hypothetical protein KatS3mg110_1886 [Pirellulaceae bacterium]
MAKEEATLDDAEDVLREAQQAVEKTIRALRTSSPEERENLRHLEQQLLELAKKLTNRTVEIAVFGEISTGKSALINALAGKQLASVDVRGGWTREVSRSSWTEYSLPGLGHSSVVLVDTPGINEIDGQERADLARRAAELADIILFVTDSDLNQIEYEALVELARYNKPIIVVINKQDLLTQQQRQRLLEVLQERLRDLVPPDRIVTAAADPREREYCIQSPDGSERTEWRKPPPDVEKLKLLVFQILEQQGLALVAANTLLFARDTSDAIVRERMRCRNQAADRCILQFAVLKGVTVAGAPGMAADIFAGLSVDLWMLVNLGRIYGLSMNRQQALHLIKALAGSVGIISATDYAIHAASSAFKTLTFGASIAVTLIPQAVAAAFSSYIVGHAAKYYLEHGGSWGDSDPREVLRRILASVDAGGVKRELRELILQRVRKNKR